MYNENALNHSRSVLEEQLQFLANTRPYIKQITPIDSVNNQKCDYLCHIDACCVCSDGTTKTVQIKNRNPGNADFVLMGKKLSGEAAENGKIGFWYNGSKYAIITTADIYLERLDGLDYVITREEINAIEDGLANLSDAKQFIAGIQPKYVYADDGSKFFSGDYYIFIGLDKLAAILKEFLRLSNPNLFND